MTEAFAVNFCFLGYTSLCTLEQRNRCYPFGVEIFEKVDSTLLHYFKQSIAAEKRLNPCHGRLCSKHWYEPWQITGKGRWHLARAGKWFVLGLIGGMIEPVSPALHGRLLTTEPPGKSCNWIELNNKCIQAEYIALCYFTFCSFAATFSESPLNTMNTVVSEMWLTTDQPAESPGDTGRLWRSRSG